MPSPKQNGRQPLPQPAAPPPEPRKDPRTRRVEERIITPATPSQALAPAAPVQSVEPTHFKGICRKFIWGLCFMGTQCTHRHEFDYEAMKVVLQFCHDHQNRTGCLRPNCTYLHTSRDEENSFLTTGQIPRVLIERYANMTTAAQRGPSTESVVTPPQPLQPVPAPHVPGVPPHMMYEYYAQPPPPPPPPPTTSQHNGTSQSPMQAPQTHDPHMPMQGPPMNMQGPPMNMQGPQMNMQGHQMPMQGPQMNMQGPQMPIQSPQMNMQGPQMNMQGPQMPMQGPPMHMQGPQMPMQGPPMPMQGPPMPMQGPPMTLHSSQIPMQGPQIPMQGPQMPMQGSHMQMHSSHMHMQGPPLGPAMQGSQMQGLMRSLQNSPNLAPPPPPPPVSGTVSNMMSPIYTEPMPSTSRTMPGHFSNQPSPGLPIFDPTRPPPSLNAPNANPRALRRPNQDDIDAGPSKVRNTDSCNDSSCEKCVQRLLRCNVLSQQMEQQRQQNEQLRTTLMSRMDDYERKKNLLKSIFRPESTRSDGFIDNASQFSSDWVESSPIQTPSSSNSNMLHQLLNMVINRSSGTNNTRSEAIDPLQAEQREMHDLLQAISGSSRPAATESNSRQLLLDLLFNSTERSSSVEPRAGELDLSRASSSSLSRLLGEGVAPSTVTSRYNALAPPTPPQPAGAGGMRAYPDSLPGPSSRPYMENVNMPGPAPPPMGMPPYGERVSFPYAVDNSQTAPPRYPAPAAPRHYHPGFDNTAVPTAAPPPQHYMPGTYTTQAPLQQPAPLPYYGHAHYPPNNVPNPPYPDPGIGLNQAPRPSTSGAQTMPQNIQNYPHDMGRYPNPHFYPPYQ